jgi:hypothetical protein
MARKKEKKAEILCFEVLDVLFGGFKGIDRPFRGGSRVYSFDPYW